MPNLQADFFRWLSFHAIAIIAFMVLATSASAVSGVDLSTGWGGTMRQEVLMASGAWGSWMFLGVARTRVMQLLARFTIMVPGLAMIGMSARALHLGFEPDRWVQWLLAGAFSLWVAATCGPAKRAFPSYRWLFVGGMAVSVVCWRIWLDGAATVGDPTLGLWWSAPVVATVTATLLPRLLAGRAPQTGQ